MQKLKQLNHLLIEFYDKLSSWEQSVVKETGYTLAQVHTIEVLGSHGPMRMKELADRLSITTGTLTVQVDKLVKAGLIVRLPQESDRRSILVDLTPRACITWAPQCTAFGVSGGFNPSPEQRGAADVDHQHD